MNHHPTPVSHSPLLGTERLRQDVRAFLVEEAAAGSYVPRCDAWLSGYDPQFSRKLGARSWIGMTWPETYGGHGRSQLERFVVLEELLAAGAPVAAHWIADRQTGPLLIRYGTQEQRERFLPAIARGECHFAIGMSEPDSGSDLASIRTAARRVEGGWRVRGTKVWSSHADRTEYMIALVRTSPSLERKHEGFSQLIVDLKDDGVEVRPIALLSGDMNFSEVVLQDVFVADDMVIGQVGNGWQQVTSELAYERSGPERFLSTFPLLNALISEVGVEPDKSIAQAMGELVARLWSLRELSIAVADSLQHGQVPTAEAALVKDLGTRFERDVIETARMLVPPEHASDHFRSLYHDAVMAAPGFTLRGGTNEILRGIVARALAPTGPSRVAPGIDPDVARLLVGTADAVFSQDAATIPAALELAGLTELAEIGLCEAALVVRVSAYHATEIPFAEQVLFPDPSDRTRGALMRSIQLAGAMIGVRDLAITYASERHQFGKPLNHFQAIQHLLAELAAEAAAADAAVGAAIAAPTPELVAAAKVVAGRAAGIVARNSHQVHGAIGFTREYPLHRLTTKLWQWRDDYGTEAQWALELGRSLAGRDLWEATTR